MAISNGMKKNSFYITTTLPYVNAPLHMGHALELVRADVIARYKKLIDFDVYFNTGTDEHGIKIYQRAQDEKIAVQDFVDRGFNTFKEQLEIFGITEDVHFIRTTDLHHEKAVQEFWKKVSANGFIYKKNYEAKYCVSCESEKTDSELKNDECLEHKGVKVSVINEENYFFKYSLFQDKLLSFYELNKDFIVPEFRFNEIKAFVSKGLQDFSISRLKTKMPWGVAVPDDKEQVIYVWFDALVNYISTLGWPEAKENFDKFWINGTPIQYCGKDNTRFQGAMWQAMLMAANLPNSNKIVVDGFITGEGGIKMSKSLGNVVDPRDIVKEYGTDALRYFLLREVNNFEDSSFTIERFRDSYNSGLANGLGNLVSRILTMAEKYEVRLSEKDLEMKYYTNQVKDLENFDINKFMNGIWLNVKHLDEYIQKEEPFKKIKIDEEKAKRDISYLLFHLYGIALSLEPIMPVTSEKILKLIKENKKPNAPLFKRLD